MIDAAVLAGGSGLRMGGELPKQFLCLAGRPVIVRSVDAFLESGLVDRIYVAVSADYVSYTRSLFDEYLPDVAVTVVPGGKNRNDTLLRVLRQIQNDGMSDDDIILTHDAVRPFIDTRIIRENIEAVKQYGACDTVVPAVDTILYSSDGRFMESVPRRSAVFHGQTPQSFRTQKLLSFYENMSEEDAERYTDACSVYLEHGEKVFLVEGSRNNIKLTYPEDREKAEMILKSRGETT